MLNAANFKSFQRLNTTFKDCLPTVKFRGTPCIVNIPLEFICFYFQVRIHWPVEKCRLLGEEVVIIDSPGIDVEADLDNWIDR